MSTFTSALTETTPDPTKHVNYTVGMVLGVDDFTQEFTYLSNRDQAIAGAAIGTGTISGLQVTVSPGPTGNAGVVQVATGTAVSPSGRTVTVPTAQCADIDQWLQANADGVTAQLGSPPGELTLSILLAYADQQTDEVPIPATPNSTNGSLSAASRLQDSFELMLAPATPTVDMGDADADFATWLARLRYANTGASTVDDLLTALRSAAAAASPPAWPPPAWSGPPRTLVIPRADAPAYLRAAVITWVTELRPGLEAEAAAATPAGSTADAPSDSLAVASLSIPVGSDGVATGAATVVTGSQPVILPQSLVQTLALGATVPQPQYSSVGRIVGAGRFELERETERSEPHLHVVFAENLEAALEPRPGTFRREAKREERLDHEHYFRLRLEHGYEEHHRYVITALPVVDGHGARHVIEEVSHPPHHGPGSHHGPFMLRLSPVEEIAQSLRFGFSVQITDLGPAHPRRTS
jgi:hypothetical protein